MPHGRKNRIDIFTRDFVKGLIAKHWHRVCEKKRVDVAIGSRPLFPKAFCREPFDIGLERQINCNTVGLGFDPLRVGALCDFQCKHLRLAPRLFRSQLSVTAYGVTSRW